MRTSPFLLGCLIITCGLSSCVTTPPRRVRGIAVARSADPFVDNEVIRAICIRLQRKEPVEGILLRYPTVSLPLRSVEVSRQPAASGKIGVPVVLGYDTTNAPLYPPEGLYIDATAILRREGGLPVLTFETQGDSVVIDGRRYAMAMDNTGASAFLKKRARHLAGSGFVSMIRPSSMQRKPQIYLLDPYDPTKTPLLMVHGLQSTPVAFAQMVDALRSNPVVRAKYQLWQFYYPSGSPVLANAADLRDSLDQTLRTLDPRSRSVAGRRIVVIGHSMGGVISHTLVSSSQDKVWSSVFKVPPSQLKGDTAAVHDLQRILQFKRDPRVARVIFMAAPHHGSPMADSFAGWVGNSLSRLSPMEETGFSRLARENSADMMPKAAAFYDAGRFSAVRTLSPKSTALIALAELPIPVPSHSIIGQRRPGPKEQGTDGVVPYWSSHLDGVVSEKIVRSGHGVIGNTDALHEVIRILEEDDSTQSRPRGK